jgi:transcriptional regulator with XRE-family HTH domain
MPTIRELRTQHGWTQDDLAAHVGVAANTVARWERGERTPLVSQFRRLAEVFEVPMESIELIERQPSDDE